jgi:hypothetical protein
VSQIAQATQSFGDWLLLEEKIEGSDDTWRKRWCMLSNLQLDIYKTNHETEPLQSFALASIKELAFGDTIAKTKQFCFTFTSVDAGQVKLVAESAERE